MKIIKTHQCASIVQPGEYTIDAWDGKRCADTQNLFYCEHCGLYYCMWKHWGIHQKEIAE